MDASCLHFTESYHLLSYDVVDSTNEEARRLADAGGQHGAVIWAQEQTHGRGRAGRQWHSPPGNLYCSLLLMPDVAPARLPQLSFVSALALYDALVDVVPQPPSMRLKWPNDVLLEGRKLGGILLETLPTPGMQDARHVILGIGLNVEHHPPATPFPATCLKGEGVEIISAKIMLSRLLSCFAPLYDTWLDRGFSPIRERWLEAAAWLGETVEIRAGEVVHTGRFIGIDEEGQILVQPHDASAPHAFAAGDVSLRHAAGG